MQVNSITLRHTVHITSFSFVTFLLICFPTLHIILQLAQHENLSQHVVFIVKHVNNSSCAMRLLLDTAFTSMNNNDTTLYEVV